jgi:hypothetical protein
VKDDQPPIAMHKTIFYDVYCHDCGRVDVWEVERGGGWREIICDACGSENVTAKRLDDV